MNNTQKKKVVTNTLIKAGVKVSDKGFYLLRDIVLEYMKEDFPMDARQEDIFSLVGKRYGMKHMCVQKYIRIPIDNAMSYADIDFLQKYFGICYRPETGTVTPKAFILRIVDDVNLQIEELLQKGGVV